MTYRARGMAVALTLSLAMWAGMLQGAALLFDNGPGIDTEVTASIK